MTVSPASAMAKTRIRVALDSNTQRLGGKAHGAEHARPVSVGVGNGAKSSVWARDLQRRGASPKTKGGYPSAKPPLKGGLGGGLKPPSPKA